MRLEDQRRFEVNAFAVSGAPTDISIRCTRCGRWALHIAEPITLDDLEQRADEHAEVCQ